MTKVEVLADFVQNVKPYVLQRYSKTDKVAMREAWSDFVDFMNKAGKVTDHQANTWTNPF